MNSDARESDFVARISDLLDLSVVAENLQKLAGEVETRLLGYKMEGESEGPPVPTTSTSPKEDFVSTLKDLTQKTRASLSELSDSLNRLHNELGGIGDSNSKTPGFSER